MDGPAQREREAERLEGAIWGHLVGDALGVPYEFRPPEAIGEVAFGARGTHRQPPGTWSDDGALMLALLDSLVAWDDTVGHAGVRFDPADQGRRIRRWYDEGAYTPDGDGRFDVGNATRAAIDALRAGVPAEEAGSVLPDGLGNGSLMRILPVALAGRGLDDATLVRWAVTASGVTHGAALPRVACALYVLLAARLLDSSDALEAPAAALAGAREALERGARRLPAGGCARPSCSPGAGARAAATSPTPSGPRGRRSRRADSYEAAVTRAIRFGHDTDTTAAIAGGLAGIRWGIDGIPAAWLAAMRGHDVAGPLVDRLLAGAGWRTSTGSPIRVDWVPLGEVPGLASAPGALGMTLLPGKRRDGYSGPHWRDPAADARRLRDVHACDTFLLLVEDVDLAMSRAWATVPALEAAGIRVIRHPVPDLDVPRDPAAYPGHPRRRAGPGPRRRTGGRRLSRRPRPDRDGRRLPARGRWRAAGRGDRARPRGPPGDGGAPCPGGLRPVVGRPRGPDLMAGRVVVVGSVNVDLVVVASRLPGPGRDRDRRRRRPASRRQGRQPGGRGRAAGRGRGVRRRGRR